VSSKTTFFVKIFLVIDQISADYYCHLPLR